MLWGKVRRQKRTSLVKFRCSFWAGDVSWEMEPAGFVPAEGLRKWSGFRAGKRNNGGK